MTDPDPVPAYFSFRYIAWFLWSHAVSILSTVQVVFQAITLDPTLLSHKTVHWITIANMVLIAILANIDRQKPPPVKGDSKSVIP